MTAGDDSEGEQLVALLEPARVDDARPDRPLRGEPLLAAGDRTLLKAERLVGRGLPRAYNPLAWTGALAGFNFILAAITGIILLFAYDTSVHSAHASIAAMQQLLRNAVMHRNYETSNAPVQWYWSAPPLVWGQMGRSWLFAVPTWK